MAKLTIGFEGLGDITYPIPDGYAGLHWSNFGATTHGSGSDGAVPHSGEAVGFNGFANPASFSADTDFKLNKGFFSGVWNDDLSVTVNAYDDGVLVGTKTFTVDYGENQLVTFDSDTLNRFRSIDTVEFVSQGGTDHDPNDAGTGAHISMDDLVLNSFSPPHAVTAVATEDAAVTGSANDLIASTYDLLI